MIIFEVILSCYTCDHTMHYKIASQRHNKFIKTNYIMYCTRLSVNLSDKHLSMNSGSLFTIVRSFCVTELTEGSLH